MQKILILFAHPALHKSRINRELITTVKDIDGVLFHNLYNAYPDFHIDVKFEQNLLLQHDIIIWQHPFYWYSAPSLIKEWIDLVLEHNFAYGRKGRALEGKKVMSAITAGGQKAAYSTEGYNRYSINQLLAPYEQTVRLCRMTYLPPFVVHGTHLLDESSIQQQCALYKELLVSLRDELFDDETITGLQYANDLLN